MTHDNGASDQPCPECNGVVLDGVCLGDCFEGEWLTSDQMRAVLGLDKSDDSEAPS